VEPVVAVDVGGTSIKAALVDASLTIRGSASSPTPERDANGAKTVTAVAALVTESQAVSAVGFVVPGTLDEKRGIARWAGNLGWRDLPIRDLLTERLQIPIAFGHDVRAGAVAEHRAGSARGAKDAVFIPIGTGVAAALVVDGEIRSADGYAGEIGHINVGHEMLCVCGKHGCLEAIASASAIARNYSARSGQGVVEATEVISRMRGGDAIAIRVWDEAVTSLSIVCEWIVTILAPERIVFGGGLAQSGSLLFDPIRKKLEASLTFQRIPQILPAHFGANAGTIGAALMAFDLITKEGVST